MWPSPSSLFTARRAHDLADRSARCRRPCLAARRSRHRACRARSRPKRAGSGKCSGSGRPRTGASRHNRCPRGSSNLVPSSCFFTRARRSSSALRSGMTMPVQPRSTSAACRGRQMELAAADVDPHVVGADHDVGIARKPEPGDIEERRQPLIGDGDVDVLELEDIADILGGAVEAWLPWRSSIRVLPAYPAPREPRSTAPIAPLALGAVGAGPSLYNSVKWNFSCRSWWWSPCWRLGRAVASASSTWRGAATRSARTS